MYLREMGTVPLLTREGEVEIARRIERGKLAVIKSISRTPLIARKVIELGDKLHSGDRTIRELVIFNDEEITDERIQERSKQVQKQIDAVRKARAALREARGEAARHAERRDDPGQAQVPPRAVGGDARANRALGLHPQDRVHRIGEAAADRGDEGRGRARAEQCSARSSQSTGS